MAEDLDYVPMPETSSSRSRQYWTERDQGRLTASRSSDPVKLGKGALPGALSLSTVTQSGLSCAAGPLEWRSQTRTAKGVPGCSPPGASRGRCRVTGRSRSVARPGRSRAKVLQRLQLGDLIFRQLTRAAAIAVLRHPQRHHRLAGPSARCRRCAHFGFGFLVTESWNPVTEKFGALAPIYGTLVTSLIAMLIAVPVGLVHRDVPDRVVPDVAAASDRHRHRTARRHPQHHLRHLGPVRVRAVPAADAAAVADRRCSATCRCCRRCLPARPTASAS